MKSKRSIKAMCSIGAIMTGILLFQGNVLYGSAETEPEITFQRFYENSIEYAVIRAESNGRIVWEYNTDVYDAAQLSRTSEIGLNHGRYFLVEDGSIIALDALTGEVIWENSDFRGSPAEHAFAFHEDGSLLISGYLGPDLFFISAEGETIARCEEAVADYYWPYELELTDFDLILITYEMYPENIGDTVVMELEELLEKYSVPEDSDSAEEIDTVRGNTPKYPVSRMIANVSTDIYASSCLSEYGMTHWAKRTVDGDLGTAWAEGASGIGVGQTITLNFDDIYALSGFRIYGGYQKNSDLYYKNGRPSEITVFFDDGDSESFALDDFQGEQVGYFQKDHSTSSLVLQIDGVYTGSTYSDTCITEIELF